MTSKKEFFDAKIKQRNKRKEVTKALKKNKSGSIPPLFEMLFVIVNRGMGDNVADYLRSKGIMSKITSFADGTANSNLQNILGLYNKEKELVMTVITIEKSNELLDEIEKKFLRAEKYVGIAFTIPLKSVVKDSIQKFV